MGHARRTGINAKAGRLRYLRLEFVVIDDVFEIKERSNHHDACSDTSIHSEPVRQDEEMGAGSRSAKSMRI